MAGHRGYTFGDFILISIVSAIWRAMVFCVAASWRAYKRSMSIIAGRPLEQCRSLYLTPALVLGIVAWLLILGALAGAPAAPSVEQGAGLVAAGLSGAAILVGTRFIIRRGCL